VLRSPVLKELAMPCPTRHLDTVRRPARIVVCLHSSGSSSRQWAALQARLAPEIRVIVPDLYGHGNARAWTGPADAIVEADAERVLEAIGGAGAPVHLVGHSYGGAVALRVAALEPDRVRSLALYEPVAFGLLLQDDEPSYAAEIVSVGNAIVEQVALGHSLAAAEQFVDYWSGPGSWSSLPPFRRTAVLDRIATVAAHFRSLLERPTGVAELCRIDQPVLLMHGERTTRPVRRLVRLLEAALPRACVTTLARLGHMGPVTDPDAVNPHIESFLDAMQTAAVVAPARVRLADAA
jgi:pimeloyl-ACP methyl ester carboxylesterase